MAPEILRNKDERQSQRADMWSLGIIIFKLLTGRHPFGNNFSEINNRITGSQNIIYLTLSELEDVSAQKNLIKNLLVEELDDKENKVRWNIEQVMNSDDIINLKNRANLSY